MFKRYFKSEVGATAMEYGLIAAGVALAIAGAVFAFGDDLADILASMGSPIETATDIAPDITEQMD